jgi:hypothetical protein
MGASWRVLFVPGSVSDFSIGRSFPRLSLFLLAEFRCDRVGSSLPDLNIRGGR